MLAINLLDRSTHRNWPAPRLDNDFICEVVSIVGLNPHGDPNVRFSWGQSLRRWQWGKKRLAYIDQRIPAIRHTQHVLKRVKFVETKTVEVPVGFADGVITFENRVQEIPHYERKVLTEAPRIIPEGWLYELELVNLEWIGEQLWVMEQWYPAEHFGPESRWNSVRYQRWPMTWAPEPDVKVMNVGEIWEDSIDPDGGKRKKRKSGMIVDSIGEYPGDGGYRALKFLGEPYQYERPILVGPKGHQVTVMVPDTHLAYRAPGRDTLEALREAWKDRETRKEFSNEELGRMRHEAYIEAEDKAEADQASLNAEMLEDRRKKIQVGYGS